MQKIADQTDILNDAVSRIDKLRVPLRKEIQELRVRTQTVHLYDRLARPGVADPVIHRSWEAAKNAAEIIGNVIAALKRDVENWQLHAIAAKERRELGQEKTYLERTTRIGEEIELLRPLMAELNQRCETLRQKLIDE